MAEFAGTWCGMCNNALLQKALQTDSEENAATFLAELAHLTKQASSFETPAFHQFSPSSETQSSYLSWSRLGLLTFPLSAYMLMLHPDFKLLPPQHQL